MTRLLKQQYVGRIRTGVQALKNVGKKGKVYYGPRVLRVSDMDNERETSSTPISTLVQDQ